MEVGYGISTTQRMEASRPKVLCFWADPGLDEPPSLTSYKALDTRMKLVFLY